MLHDLTHRAGHAALLIAGTETPVEESANLRDPLPRAAGASLLEAACFHAPAPSAGDFRLESAAVAELGIEGLTLLVLPPDGHVGLRADRNHLAALAAYEAPLQAG